MKTVPLNVVSPGTLVSLPGLHIQARLHMVNECRARVRIIGTPRVVEFGDRCFLADGGRWADWSPRTMVFVQS